MERQIAEFAGAKLAQDTRIATFSINGWDTHDNQEFGLRRALRKLSESILALKDASGPEAWENTAVIAMTEFGRTARINGTKGTDHGTGGAVIMAGGALKGHKVHTRWPGLAEADLFAKRDLMPTRDVRAFPAWLIHGLFGTDKKVLQTEIFPDLDMGSDPGLLS